MHLRFTLQSDSYVSLISSLEDLSVGSLSLHHCYERLEQEAFTMGASHTDKHGAQFNFYTWQNGTFFE